MRLQQIASLLVALALVFAATFVLLGALELTPVPVASAAAPRYRAEFAPALVVGDPQENALNPALIERMRAETPDITVVQMTSGEQYRVRCSLNAPPDRHTSCSWLFRVGIWVEN